MTRGRSSGSGVAFSNWPHEIICEWVMAEELEETREYKDLFLEVLKLVYHVNEQDYLQVIQTDGLSRGHELIDEKAKAFMASLIRFMDRRYGRAELTK